VPYFSVFALTGGCGGVGAGAWKSRAKMITQIDDAAGMFGTACLICFKIIF
jgi:hypothetical protein